MKRNAGSDLNHDNWDKEDIKEERGKFATADVNIIAQRKVISARRKPASQTSGIFKSFSGFSNVSSAPFSLNSNLGATNSENLDLIKEKHLNSLKILNQKFLENICKNVEENPICILTPLLDDYRSHLSIIKNKYPLQRNSNMNSKDIEINLISNEHENEANQNISIFELKPMDNKVSNTYKAFTASSKNSNNINHSALNNKEIKNFGSSSNSFSFFDYKTTELPFSNETPMFLKKTGNVEKNSEDINLTKSQNILKNDFAQGSTIFLNNESIKKFNVQDTTVDDDDVYEPPLPEVREVKEADSIYNVKCKLYFQKNKEWKERGVGNLFIKPYKPNQCQLVIRADNSLATIILNVMVNSTTPMNTQKNNVSIVTKTDFVDGAAPTPLLIRVKTAEKAEELLKALQTQLLCIAD